MMLTSMILVSAEILRPAKNIVIADFEEATYGLWKVTGTAFGAGPAHGALPNQMPVDGFVGQGLANSYFGGDASVGTLTSPPFKITRKRINFLIGGGRDPEKLRVDLIVDGKVVRSATGPNDRPGGSESLAWSGWDISEFVARYGTIQIVDQATGGWGHINVDQIVMTDRQPPALLKGVIRSLEIDKRYLNLPVKNGAKKRWITFSVPGEAPQRFDIELADGKPDWWAFIDVSARKGKVATLKIDELPDDSNGLASVDQTDRIKGSNDLYREALRPQFHFTSRRGWLNDPNGLVFYKGEYHLFYQHNPFGWSWGNMSWGHAVSRDLVHWKELAVALTPDDSGTVFSGSAVVDANNTSGFKNGTESPIVAIYTAAGKPFTQGIAFSNDRGRSWTRYAGNPVIPHIVADNRDPKVVWYEPTKKWVMALYLDGDEYALFSSNDLKSWQELQRLSIPGTSECPNFFPLTVAGEPATKKWVFYGANGGYLVGDFDGNHFTPHGPPKRIQSGNCWYAAQVYSNIPSSDGRTILIPWGQQELPGMTFNQILGIPVELTLRKSDNGLIVCSAPARELQSLRTAHRHWENPPLGSSRSLTLKSDELAELETVISPGTTGKIEFNMRGLKVTYLPETRQLSCLDRKTTLAPVNGKLRLHFLVDRTSVDIFGNDGRLYMPMGSRLDRSNRTISISANGNGAKIDTLDLYDLKSSWP